MNLTPEHHDDEALFPAGSGPYLVGLALLALVLAAFAGVAVGRWNDQRIIDAIERNRRATCQVLDHVGADASSIAQVEPCLGTEARLPSCVTPDGELAVLPDVAPGVPAACRRP